MSISQSEWIRFKRKEKKFFQTETLSLPEELSLDSLCFYGDILFFLLGLKPLVLFSYLNEEIMGRYRDLLLNEFVLKKSHFLFKQLKGVHTGFHDLENEFVLINTQHVLYERIVESVLEVEGLINDDLLGELLDYPCGVPDVDGEVFEVGYFDGEDLVMSYFCSKCDFDDVAVHFDRYRISSQDYCELTLKVVDVTE